MGGYESLEGELKIGAWVVVVAACVGLQGLGAQEQKIPSQTAAQETSAMAARVMKMWPAGVVDHVGHPGSWGYEAGVPLDGMAAEWAVTQDAAEFAYIQAAADRFVSEDGVIRMDGPDKPARVYPAEEHTLDDVELGRAVLLVYSVTGDKRYATAARFLRARLAEQPRTPSGAYWHKQIYPNQVWLDGAYMAGPFLAAYGVAFQEPGDFDDVAKEMLLMDARMRDPKTGLLRHGWDDSPGGKMPWADTKTGLSPEAWGRADGWYAMALVDVLDWLPNEHPQRPALIDAPKRTMAAVVKYQDKVSGVWWQVMDKGGAPGNYLEASASCMFVDALAKGVRMGYLPKGDAALARRGWEGIQKQFIRQGADGPVLTGTVKVGGLGGKPYRAGDYAYYGGEKVQEDDPKGVGSYLKAGAEMQLLR